MHVSNTWLDTLMALLGADLMRMKGLVHVATSMARLSFMPSNMFSRPSCSRTGQAGTGGHALC